MSAIANISRQSGRLGPGIKQALYFCTWPANHYSKTDAEGAATGYNVNAKSARIVEFQKKLRAKTPIGRLDELSTHPHQEKEPLKPWPNSVNPNTGEIGGPSGPEPTRYGDWERKGRVSDF